MQNGEKLPAQYIGRLYQCTLCGHCTQVCSTRIDLRRFWLEARAGVCRRGLAPEGLAAARDNVARSGNVYGYPNSERAGWAEYMADAPDDLYQRDRADVAYFVGCSSSFSPRAQRIAESFVRAMTSAGVDFSILGEAESCCGFPMLAAGMRQGANALIERNLEAVRSLEATTVVFTCPACRMMWLEEYAARLPGVRMLHSTELLAELAADGRLPLKTLERKVTYHDPCDLARNGGVYEPPLRMLEAIPGVLLLEAHDRRERGLCCGGGGDLEMVDPVLVGQVAARTVRKLAATGAESIVTACPQCVRVLTRGAEEAGQKIEVLDIVELVAASVGRA